MLKLTKILFVLFIFAELILAQGITVNRKHYFDNLGVGGGCTLAVVSFCGDSTGSGDVAFNAVGTAWVATRMENPSAGYTVDELDLYVASIIGDLSGVDFVAMIWTLKANGYDLDEQIGSASNVTTGLTTGRNVFTFASQTSVPDTATYGYAYAFMRDDLSYDPDNYANVNYGNTNWTTGEDAGFIKGTKTGWTASEENNTFEFTVRILSCD